MAIGSLKKKLRTIKHAYFDNFVFIHINKTGGSSVERALNIPFEHKTALEKIEQIGEARWRRKYSFAVIRNPWDKVVSHYHYRVQTNQTDLGRKEVGFNDWVRLSYGEKDRRFYDNPKMFMPQMEWITGYKGEILINGFIHFESLNEDFQEVCRKIGKTAVLPHVKASSRGDYRSYYEDDTAEIIRTWFERDIEKFGYRF